MTLPELALIIAQFKCQHGVEPTHLFVPASELKHMLDTTRIGSVVLVEVFDPAVKNVLAATCYTYDVSR